MDRLGRTDRLEPYLMRDFARLCVCVCIMREQRAKNRREGDYTVEKR